MSYNTLKRVDLYLDFFLEAIPVLVGRKQKGQILKLKSLLDRELRRRIQ